MVSLWCCRRSIFFNLVQLLISYPIFPLLLAILAKRILPTSQDHHWPSSHLHFPPSPSSPPPSPAQSPLGGTRDDASLLVFVHVSDLHLSDYRAEGVQAFRHFTSKVLSVVQPAVVLASGDLTDAKTLRVFDSRSYGQRESEWTAYRAALQDSGWYDPTRWLDMAGNHCKFGVGSPQDDLFSRYSTWALREKHGRHYAHVVERGASRYKFVSLDATPVPGQMRHFFGHFDGEAADFLVEELRRSKEQGVNQTVVFGHYPLSTTSAEPGRYGVSVTDLLLSTPTPVVTYFCGHLHALGGLTYRMHSRHASGTLELEIPDFKLSRRYRVCAFDNDLFSFTDVIMETSPGVGEDGEGVEVDPVLLVTNPKDAQYLSEHEPFHRIATSTHVRFLYFSEHPIKRLWVDVDGRLTLHQGEIDPDSDVVSVEHPFYAVRWSPELVGLDGLHTITVEIEDTLGRLTSQRHEFSLDGTYRSLFTPYLAFNWPFWLYAALWILFGVVIFGVLVYGRLWAMAIPQYSAWRAQTLELMCSSCDAGDWRAALQRRWRSILFAVADLCRDNFRWRFLMGYSLILALGPLFFGRIFKSSYGLMTSTLMFTQDGIFVNREASMLLLPLIVLFYWPLVQTCLMHSFHAHCAQQVRNRLPCKHASLWSGWGLLLVLLTSLGAIAQCVFIVVGYGLEALLLSPAYLWAFVAAIVVWSRLLLKERAALRAAALPDPAKTS